MRVAQACLENVCPDQFRSIADLYPDLVRHLHVQIRLMGNFGINGGVLWLTNTDGELLMIVSIIEHLITPLFLSQTVRSQLLVTSAMCKRKTLLSIL